MRGLDSTAVVSLERQGLGASAGLGLFCVLGNGSTTPSPLGLARDSPGICDWTVFGLGATGGLCVPEER